MAKKHRAVKHPGYERTDAQLKPILWLGVILAVGTVAVMLGMAWLMRFLETQHAAAHPPPPPIFVTDVTPPEPRLQVVPPLEIEEIRAREEAILNSYGWVDRTFDVVRIPIDRAIDLVAERGLPAREEEADAEAEIEEEIATSAGEAPLEEN